MNRQKEYRQIMESIRLAHQAFATAWSQVRTLSLKTIPPDEQLGLMGWIWKANGEAYRATNSLADRRNRFIEVLFRGRLQPLHQALDRGDPEAVDAIIDFLEVDVVAFRCGYAKEEYLQKLKKTPLTEEHRERLRKYGLSLCSIRAHRREIARAGQLMIRVANPQLINELRALASGNDLWPKKKAIKMLRVIQNGRPDLV